MSAIAATAAMGAPYAAAAMPLGIRGLSGAMNNQGWLGNYLTKGLSPPLRQSVLQSIIGAGKPWQNNLMADPSYNPEKEL
jgi:hypothetical protein